MAADDSDPGSIDAEVYEYAYNGGVMGYHDTAQELELSVEYPDGTEGPDEGLHLDGGEDPDGDRWNWNRTGELDPAVWLSSAVDLEPTTPSPTAVERETSEMLDFLTAQPQPDQLQADPEPPAGSDTALPLVGLLRQGWDLAAYRRHHAAFYRGR